MNARVAGPGRANEEADRRSHAAAEDEDVNFDDAVVMEFVVEFDGAQDSADEQVDDDDWLTNDYWIDDSIEDGCTLELHSVRLPSNHQLITVSLL